MKKTCNIFIIMLLVSTIFFGFMSGSVIAEDNKIRTDLEDFMVGSTAGTGDLYSWATVSGNDGDIRVHTVNDTTKSIYTYAVSSDANEVIEFYPSLSSGNIINNTKIEIDLMSYTRIADSGTKGYFIFQSYYDDVLQWELRHVGYVSGVDDITYWEWKDCNGTYQATTNSNWAYGDWKELTIFVNKSTQSQYGTQFNVDICEGWGDDLVLLESFEYCYSIWQGIYEGMDTLKISNVDGGEDSWWVFHGAYIGNIEFIGDLSPPTPEYPVDQWQYIGDMNYDGSYGLSGLSIDEKYGVPFSGEIKAVDLKVSSYQISDISSDLNDYYLYINGETQVYHFNPVAFIPIGNKYIIRWYWLNQTIDNKDVVYEFVCLGDDGTSNWKVGVSEDDNDDDGESNFRYGELPPDYDTWFNGLYDAPYIVDYDLCYRMYYVGDTYEPNYNYTDWVTVNDGVHYTNTTLFISYSISTKEYDNYMELWKDGERMGIEYGFGGDGENGKLLTAYSSSLGYTPTESGSYSVNIIRNGVNVTAYAFTVLENPVADYYLYTVPNPSEYPTSFKIEYKFFHGEGKDGIISLNDVQDFSDPQEHLYYVNIDANTTGNFTYSPSAISDVLYCFMGVEISTEVYTLASFVPNPHIHFINDGVTSNYLELSDDLIIFENSHNQYVLGHHNHYGSVVKVLDNGEPVKDVSTTSNFHFSYYVHAEGNHKVDLVVYGSNGSQILATQYFNARNEEPDEIDESDGFEVLGEYKMWLGVGIIVLFLLMPLGVSIKSYVDVPIIVYIAMGAIGAGVSVSLGLLDMYWLLLLLVALVTGAVLSKWGGL